jgi:hypothetical protein
MAADEADERGKHETGLCKATSRHGGGTEGYNERAQVGGSPSFPLASNAMYNVCYATS